MEADAEVTLELVQETLNNRKYFFTDAKRANQLKAVLTPTIMPYEKLPAKHQQMWDVQVAEVLNGIRRACAPPSNVDMTDSAGNDLRENEAFLSSLILVVYRERGSLFKNGHAEKTDWLDKVKKWVEKDSTILFDHHGAVRFVDRWWERFTGQERERQLRARKSESQSSSAEAAAQELIHQRERECQEQIAKLKDGHSQAISELMCAHLRELAQQKDAFQTELSALKEEHARFVAKLKEEHTKAHFTEMVALQVQIATLRTELNIRIGGTSPPAEQHPHLPNPPAYNPNGGDENLLRPPVLHPLL